MIKKIIKHVEENKESIYAQGRQIQCVRWILSVLNEIYKHEELSVNIRTYTHFKALFLRFNLEYSNRSYVT